MPGNWVIVHFYCPYLAEIQNMLNDNSRSSLELLFNVSKELTAALDLKTLLTRVVALSMSNVGAERGSIVVLDNMGQPIDGAIICGKRIQEHTTQQLRDTIQKGLAGWVIKHRIPTLILDTSRDERWLRRPDDMPEHSGAKSAICAPLLARERMVGVLTLVHPAPNSFTQEHLDLLQAIADQAGIAVLNARLYSESQRQARVMTALAETAVTINASLNLNEVFQQLLDKTAQALSVQDVFLALVDASGQDLEFRAGAGLHSQKILGTRIRLGKGIAGKVAKEGKGVIVLNSGQVDITEFPDINIKSLICAPMRSQGRLMGVLEAFNPTTTSFDPDALLVLTGIGSIAGTAIHNAQLYEMLGVTERRYHELFDESINPILITNWRGQILEVNRRAAQILNQPPEKLKGTSIHDSHIIDTEKISLANEQLTAGETPSYETTLITQKGNQIPVEVYLHKVNYQNTDCLQWMLRDISASKELERLREDLMAMIYHDLRAPLSNVETSLGMLASMLPVENEPTIKSILSIVTRSMDRLQRLIDSLLDIHRLDSGQAVIKQKNTSLSNLVADALEIVAPMAEGKRQKINVLVSHELPEIWADSDMLRRVLINLIENATKYTPSDGQIFISAQQQDLFINVCIRDTGPGILPEDQDRVFNKYIRLKNKESIHGLGLGLAFCKLVIEAHGGKIWIESQKGEGTSFIFSIPVGKPDNSDETPAEIE
jgi:NtrC-family two-component system sensor histidine kinase KinB